MANKIRVRIAPSPTGLFHIGTARTALFNYLFARKNGGVFIVRIEDTDKERSRPEFTADILESLRWLNLKWNEGPEIGGEFGPYFQSERTASYKKYLDDLLAKNKAYKCFCTPEELERERQVQQKQGIAPKYSGKCRNLTNEQVAENERQGKLYVIRFKSEAQTIAFNDLIKGGISFDSGLFGDFTLTRSDGAPLFIFAVVVDDYEMKISHVLRGEDHVSNTIKHCMIAEALGAPLPAFGHFPLIFNPDHSKMSKRKDPVSITDDYMKKGYLSEALINFIALLGWNDGTDQEIYSLDELINQFSLDRIGKSPSIFDENKLLWMNGYYLRQLSLGELATRVEDFLNPELKEKTKQHKELYMKALSLIQERIKLLSEINQLIGFFFDQPEYPSELAIAKKSTKQNTVVALELASKELSELDDFRLESTEPALRLVAQNHDLTAGELLWALRVALSGLSASPGAFELLEALGKEESLTRIAKAIEKLQSH